MQTPDAARPPAKCPPDAASGAPRVKSDGVRARAVAPRVLVDVEIPSDVKQIESVVRDVTDICHELRLPRRQCSLNIPVALSEALSNAIIRGNKEDPAKLVRLRATLSDAAVVFDVADEGRGFDMAAQAHDPTAPEHLQREEGRGLFLMHQLMDRVEQLRGAQHVVRLTLNR